MKKLLSLLVTMGLMMSMCSVAYASEGNGGVNGGIPSYTDRVGLRDDAGNKVPDGTAWRTFDRETGLLTYGGTGSVDARFIFLNDVDLINKIVFEEGITSILGGTGFQNVTSVELPSTLTSIELGSFQYSPKIEHFEFPDSMTEIKNSVLAGDYGITSVKLPNKLERIGKSAFAFNSFKTIELPDTLTHIGDNAFEGCQNLEYIDIPDSVTYIGTDAFNYCTSLKEINLPNTITTLPSASVPNFSPIKHFTIPDSVTTLGYNSLVGTDNVETITIPVSVVNFEEAVLGISYNWGKPQQETVFIYEGTKAQWKAININPEYNEWVNSYNIQCTDGPLNPGYAPYKKPVEVKKATPNSSSVVIDGNAIAFEAYTINDSNYFKLRDVASVLSGSPKQFSVGWEDGVGITLTSNEAYTVIGGELNAADGIAKEYTKNVSPIHKDGTKVELTAYTINGNNFFKLRDLGELFDFGIGWDGVNNKISVDTNSSYEQD